jgi:hypothetical protein
MEQERLIPQHRQIAQLILGFSPDLTAMQHQQWKILGNLNAENMFRIDQEKQTIFIMNEMFHISFALVHNQHTPFIQYNFNDQDQHAELLEDFFLNDVGFLTDQLNEQHSLFLKNKAQQLRELIAKQIYQWVDGPTRVIACLNQMSMTQAELLDRRLMVLGMAKYACFAQSKQMGTDLDPALQQHFSQLCVLHIVNGEDFLPLQGLMDCYDELCHSAAQFLPSALYRIATLTFEQKFNLDELLDHQMDFALLQPYALQQSHVLSFVRLMNRELWHKDDLLAKQNFLQPNAQIWQKKVARLPIFDYSRTVNWLFKQDAMVLDWLSAHIQHSHVRIAVTALSFVDTSQIHPCIILLTLQYFQHTCARMFIQSCDIHATTEQWFEHQNNQSVVLKGQQQTVEDQRIAISPSILYLDEWMNLLRNVANKNETIVKQVYKKISRVMQAYMLHLHHIVQDLPHELLNYVHPSTHQNRGFYRTLRRHHVPVNEFRALFYLRYQNLRVSVFDAYVRDYLIYCFNENREIAKNSTWLGLFHHAVEWHRQLHKDEILARLKQSFAVNTWNAVSPQTILQYSGWSFEELHQIERIIEESNVFHHCLAMSYAERIMQGEYVAFHMSSPHYAQSLTLGCHIQAGKLLFDQLEYPNNQKAEQLLVTIAEQFIQWFNEHFSPSQK